jgi:peroxiredoxin
MAAATVPKIGEIAPDATVRDCDAVERRLSQLTVGGSLVLIFYRGHW